MLGTYLVAKVALSNTAYSFDTEYSYSVSDEISQRLTVGCRVLVPFGKGNRKRIGFVTRTYESTSLNPKLKPVLNLIDDASLVNDELMRLIFWLKENTFCTFFEAYKTVVPTGFSYNFIQHYTLVNSEIDVELTEEEQSVVNFMRSTENAKEIDAFLDVNANPAKRKIVESLVEKGAIEEVNEFKRKIGDETVKMISLSDDYTDGRVSVKLTPKQKLVVELLSECGSASIKEVNYMTNVTSTIIKRLVSNNVLFEFEYKTLRSVDVRTESDINLDDIVLSDEQQNAFDGICKLVDDGKPCGALLHGVTGSGKTAVFIKLIEHTLSMGKTAIMLVPEISLTPQMVGKFRGLFGKTVAVIHSSLSLGQRVDEFKRIKSGDAKIVIGTRSAVFAPLENIGIIIMDEEGERTYKSDNSPRYHARDVAINRCGFNNSVLLMASATPSIETYYYAKNGRFHFFELNSRYSEQGLPQVVTVDMQLESEEGNDGLFSQSLIDEIRQTLVKNEQIILLLNRRGFNSYLSCCSCRKPVECPNCNVPLTYHKKNERLMCHYCGYSKSAECTCEHCGSTQFLSRGAGTQRVEDEISDMFPNARILRMDADTTYSRYAYEKNFSDFANGKYDILLGTQMIAKGLDFPNVTLVGVLSLDKALYAGDFKCYERTFSLITQVVGRSGRGEKAGKAFIQTYVPEHYVLELASRQDYKEFYNQEISLRKTLVFPPFCDICVIAFSSLLDSAASKASDAFMTLLKDYLSENKATFPLRVLGPSQCHVGKINNRYRYRLIMKTKNNREFRAMIDKLLKQSSKLPVFSNVRVFADINGDII